METTLPPSPRPALSADRTRLQRPRLQKLRIVSTLRNILETFVTVLVMYTLVNLVTARFVVDGESMAPNLATGQFILVSRVHYLLGAPERGDIVVFHYPNQPDSDYIKRMIGLPGETVRIQDTQVFIDDVPLHELYIAEACSPSMCPDGVWTLGADQFFLMGDNRNHSSDSRSFGVVERRFIVGEAIFRYFPLQDAGVVMRLGT
ncbi:MAG: signal peptidase I [bacterium]|nr:signal peptidase I [bacterium]